MSLLTTASQTVGPYVRIGFGPSSIEDLAPAGVPGERITLSGRVTDGDGKPVNDGIVEIWQANAQGKYAHPEDAQDKPVDARFRGFGRSLTRADGGYRFATIKPGRVPGPGGTLAGTAHRSHDLHAGTPQAPDHAGVLSGRPGERRRRGAEARPADRRATLIAHRMPGDQSALEWNVRVQGQDETVFFDY